MGQPLVGEDATKISDHVWAIMGFPNIAIVVGSRWDTSDDASFQAAAGLKATHYL
jgi:hypothetical protein